MKKDVEKLLNKENPEENDNKENSEHEDAADEINETENLQTNELDGIWKNQMLNNSNAVTYGNGVADIIDYAIIDEKGKTKFSISKGSNFFNPYENSVLSGCEATNFCLYIKKMSKEQKSQEPIQCSKSRQSIR